MQLNNKFSVSMLIGSAACLAIGTVLAKPFLDDLSPLLFLVVQLGASICFLWSMILFQKVQLVSGESLMPLILIGLIIGIGAICTILALRFSSASQASLIFATQPVLIMAFAWSLLRERPKTIFMLLGILAIIGVAIIVGNPSSSDSNNTFWGNIFALSSTACAALYVVWMRRITSTQNPLIALAILQTVAMIVGFLAWLTGGHIAPHMSSNVSMFQLMAAAGTGIIYYGLAFWLYLLGLQKVPASLAGLYLNLVPVFTVGLAFVLLGERLTSMQWGGATIVLASVAGISLLIARNEQSSKQVSDDTSQVARPTKEFS